MVQTKGMSFTRVITKERLVTASIIIFIIMVLLFYLPPLNDYWMEEDGNFTLFTAGVFVLFLVLTVLGGIVIYKSGLQALKMEQKGFTIFAVGAILLFTVPFLSGLEILPTGQDFMGPIHIILLLIGIVICLIGMFMMARFGGFFSIWIFGTLFLTVLGFHEAFNVVIYTGTFGPVDRFLMYEGCGILLASFILYIYSELKFVYLAYKIEEAQGYNDEKEYERAIEVLKHVLTIYPNYPTALNNMGNIYYRMKLYDEAADCYDKVSFINPEYPHTENNMKMVAKKLKMGRKSTT